MYSDRIGEVHVEIVCERTHANSRALARAHTMGGVCGRARAIGITTIMCHHDRLRRVISIAAKRITVSLRRDVMM